MEKSEFYKVVREAYSSSRCLSLKWDRGNGILSKKCSVSKKEDSFLLYPIQEEISDQSQPLLDQPLDINLIGGYKNIISARTDSSKTL